MAMVWMLHLDCVCDVHVGLVLEDHHHNGRHLPTVKCKLSLMAEIR